MNRNNSPRGSMFSLLGVGILAAIIGSILSFLFLIEPQLYDLEQQINDLKLDLESQERAFGRLIENLRRDFSLLGVEIIEGSTTELQGMAVPSFVFSDLIPDKPFKILWKASEIISSCTDGFGGGAFDDSAEIWYETSFDDSGWNVIGFPDNWSGDTKDRFYRGYFYLDIPESELRQLNYRIAFERNDDFRLFVNATELPRSMINESEEFSCYSEGARTASFNSDNIFNNGLNIIAIHLTNQRDNAILDFAIHPIF